MPSHHFPLRHTTTVFTTTDNPPDSLTHPRDRLPAGSEGLSAPGRSVLVMHAVQATFADLGTLLSGVTFVVVDLETTGAPPPRARSPRSERSRSAVARCPVSSRRWSTLAPRFRRSSACSPGISDVMVASAPRIDAVLPAFLEFARDSVPVAHNAGFDVSFLRAAATDRAPVARLPGRRHRPPRPPSGQLGRGAHNRKLSTFSRVCSPRRRRRTTERCPTRAPPSTSCTPSSAGWQPGRPHPRRAAQLFHPGVSPAQRRKRFPC